MSADTFPQTAEQRVVVWDKPGDGSKAYDTVYNDEQARRAIVNCVEEHGPDRNVRTVKSADFNP